MELSLEMSEDENCTFITTNLLEQTDNFDEWLDKNGVQYILRNECLNENLINYQLDPLLNQINPDENFDNLSDTETNLVEQRNIMQPSFEREKRNGTKVKAGKSKCNFTTLTCKSTYFEKLLINGINVKFTAAAKTIQLTLTDNGNNPIIYPRLYISLKETGGQVTIAKNQLSVESLELITLSSHIKALMPCLTLETGLRLFVCPDPNCGLVYTRKDAAQMHTLVQISHKPFKCDFPGCTWAFYNSFKLRRHQDSHTNVKGATCNVNNCGRKFTNVYNLKVHIIKTHNRPATFQCSVDGCDLKFQTSRLREKHFKTHDISEAPFQCPHNNCIKAFFVASGLTAHVRIHSHKESDLRCSYPNCGKIFEQPCRLKEHARQHNGIRPYSCTYEKCSWTFTTASKLKRHQSTHTKERKFHCTIGTCNKSFLRSEHLKDHTLTHIGQRSFQCEVCVASFFGKSSLCLHIKKMHPEKSSETCSSTISVVPVPESPEKPTAEMLLEQAIQSLGVPSDAIIGTGLLPEEPLAILETENFSTVNLRDLD